MHMSDNMRVFPTPGKCKNELSNVQCRISELRGGLVLGVKVLKGQKQQLPLEKFCFAAQPPENIVDTTLDSLKDPGTILCASVSPRVRERAAAS